MDEDAGNITAPPTHGCMERKVQRPYTVEHFANGNTGWRCTVCGHMLNLIPGKYTSTLVDRGSDAETFISSSTRRDD